MRHVPSPSISPARQLTVGSSNGWTSTTSIVPVSDVPSVSDVNSKTRWPAGRPLIVPPFTPGNSSTDKPTTTASATPSSATWTPSVSSTSSFQSASTALHGAPLQSSEQGEPAYPTWVREMLEIDAPPPSPACRMAGGSFLRSSGRTGLIRIPSTDVGMSAGISAGVRSGMATR